MNGCAIGSLTYKYAYLLQNGRVKEADNLLCKLSWLIDSECTTSRYIPVGTLISFAGTDACGVTSFVLGFDPQEPVGTVTIAVTLTVAGNPVVVAGTYSTLTDALNAVIDAIDGATGATYTYQEIAPYTYLICSDYTQNGVTISIIFTYSIVIGMLVLQLGTLTETTTLADGEAPGSPVYQTAEDNCITATQYDNILQAQRQIKKGVGCCDIPAPIPMVCVSDSSGGNIELREDLNLEERENGN